MRKEWRKKIHLQEKNLKEKNLQQIKWLIYEGKIAELQGEGQINKKKTPQNYEEKIVKCMLL